MPRINRAAQFAPFDALKGLNNAFMLKVYDHEKISEGELSEEEVFEISNTLKNLKAGDSFEITYFDDGYYRTIFGKTKLLLEENSLLVEKQKINLNCLKSIKKLKKT